MKNAWFEIEWASSLAWSQEELGENQRMKNRVVWGAGARPGASLMASEEEWGPPLIKKRDGCFWKPHLTFSSSIPDNIYSSTHCRSTCPHVYTRSFFHCWVRWCILSRPPPQGSKTASAALVPEQIKPLSALFSQFLLLYKKRPVAFRE